MLGKHCFNLDSSSTLYFFMLQFHQYIALSLFVQSYCVQFACSRFHCIDIDHSHVSHTTRDYK